MKLSNPLTKERILIILILMLGICLRTINITERGLLLADEGHYANVAKTPLYTLRWLLHKESIKTEEERSTSLENYLRNHGCYISAAKPGHTFLLSFGYLLFGIHDYSPLLISVFWGITTLLLLYLVGKSLFNRKIALLSTLVLTISGIHIYYSKSALYVSGIFFSLLATYLYLLSHERSKHPLLMIILSGLTMGFAFTIDPKVGFIALSLFLSELFLYIKSKVLVNKHVLKRVLFLSLSIATPLLIVEGLYRLLYSVFNVKIEMGTYFDYLFWKTTVLVDSAEGAYYGKIVDILFYPKVFWKFEGPLVTLLLALGIVLFLIKFVRNLDIKYFIFPVQVLMTIFYWTYYTGGHPSIKVIPAILPSIALMSGFALVWCSKQLSSYFKNRTVAVNSFLAVVSAIVIVLGVVNSKEIIFLKTNYQKASEKTVEYIRKNGGIVTSHQQNLGQIWAFYMNVAIEKYPETYEHIILDPDYEIQGDYVITDFRQYGKSEYLKKVLDVEKRMTPVVVLENNFVTKIDPLLLYLRGGSVMHNYVLIPSKKYLGFKYIRIYDLRKMNSNFL